jgi:hypothetical protein
MDMRRQIRARERGKLPIADCRLPIADFTEANEDNEEEKTLGKLTINDCRLEKWQGQRAGGKGAGLSLAGVTGCAGNPGLVSAFLDT